MKAHLENADRSAGDSKRGQGPGACRSHSPTQEGAGQHHGHQEGYLYLASPEPPNAVSHHVGEMGLAQGLNEREHWGVQTESEQQTGTEASP
jgi:hypothetical protein